MLTQPSIKNQTARQIPKGWIANTPYLKVVGIILKKRSIVRWHSETHHLTVQTSNFTPLSSLVCNASSCADTAHLLSSLSVLTVVTISLHSRISNEAGTASRLPRPNWHCCPLVHSLQSTISSVVTYVPKCPSGSPSPSYLAKSSQSCVCDPPRERGNPGAIWRRRMVSLDMIAQIPRLLLFRRFI